MKRLPEQPAEGTERTVVTIALVADTLAAAGVASPRADAELLTAYVLGVSRSRLVLASGLTAGQHARLAELVAARARRVPVQHLTGRAGFRRLELAVGPGVFVPRPETELLAGWGIETLASHAAAAGPVAANRPDAVSSRPDAVSSRPEAVSSRPEAVSSRPEAVDGPVVVDLCSGSGAVALAVANEVPAACVYAVERDPAALGWLRRNSEERAAAGDRPVRVVAGDVTDPGLLADLRGRVDVVLCNPPYVPRGTPVPPEVAGGDPDQAVFGGPDGLAVIAPVVDLAAALLRPGGAVGIEHDESHAPEVVELLARNECFAEIADHRDLAGRPRFATASRLRGRLLP